MNIQKSFQKKWYEYQNIPLAIHQIENVTSILVSYFSQDVFEKSVQEFNMYYRTEGLCLKEVADYGERDTIAQAKDENELFFHIIHKLSYICAQNYELAHRNEYSNNWRYLRTMIDGHQKYYENDDYKYNTIEDNRKLIFEKHIGAMVAVFSLREIEKTVSKYTTLLNLHFPDSHWKFDTEKLEFVEISSSKEIDFNKKEMPQPDQIVNQPFKMQIPTKTAKMTNQEPVYPIYITKNSFEVNQNRLVKFQPQDCSDLDPIILPDCVYEIGKNAFNFKSRHMEIYISKNVTLIEDNPFPLAETVTIYGHTGSYVENYLREHKKQLPPCSFIPICHPDTHTLESNPQKASETKYPSIMNSFIKFEASATSLSSPYTLPYTLFQAKRETRYSGGCMSVDETLIKLQKNGQLLAETICTIKLERSFVTPPPIITTREISYDSLSDFILQSKDPNAARYQGMTADNWRDYLWGPKLPQKNSDLPIVQFGCYQQFSNTEKIPVDWYILDEKDGYLLLLSRLGLDLCPYFLNAYLPTPITDKQLKNWHNGPYSWKNSNLYHWLNNDFINEAFSENERQYINTKSSLSQGVFCLNTEEFNQYLQKDPAAAVFPSEYALNKGAALMTVKQNESIPQNIGRSMWWLRDSVYHQTFSSFAQAGIVWATGQPGNRFADHQRVCARPAVWVSIDYWTNRE